MAGVNGVSVPDPDPEVVPHEITIRYWQMYGDWLAVLSKKSLRKVIKYYNRERKKLKDSKTEADLIIYKDLNRLVNGHLRECYATVHSELASPETASQSQLAVLRSLSIMITRTGTKPE